MKTTITTFKVFVLFLSCLMLFQSCHVYHNVPVTLEQAAQESKRTKLKTTYNQTYVYKTIVYEDSEFFGIKKIKGKNTKTRLDSANIQTIRLENKSLSTILSVGLVLASIGAIVLIEFSMNFNMWGGHSIPSYCCGFGPI